MLTYYMFDEPAVNGFSPELSRLRDGDGQFKIIGERTIEIVLNHCDTRVAGEAVADAFEHSG